MPLPHADSPKRLAPLAVLAGSVLILLHFVAIGALVLSATSGPWPTRFGESPAEGPYFAGMLNRVFFPYYLEPLRLTHNYHYTSDRPLLSSVYFEARMKDAQGNVFKTVKLPEATGNAWLRHRYHLLAMGLGNDQPVQSARSEVIPAPGQKMRQVTFWEPGEGNTLRLVEKDEHLVPKGQTVRPSDWTMLLARSYQRHLSRKYNAASVELVRHSKEPVMPALMFLPNAEAPPGTFDELVSSFGDYRREK